MPKTRPAGARATSIVRGHKTDYGNAQRLVDRHGHDIRYLHERQQWLVWDGHRWCIDQRYAVVDKAAETVLAMYRNGWADWGRKSQSQYRLRAMVDLARSLRSRGDAITITAADLDRHRSLLNTENGTLDLEADILRPPQRADMLTKIAPVSYHPTASCPTWMTFLNDVFAGDQELTSWVQKAVGYSLTGETCEQVLFIMLGTGSNGKGVFMRILSSLLGSEYARTAQAATFMTNDSSKVRSDLARLSGARIVTVVEPNQGIRFDEGLVKQLTGEDRITVAYKFENEFEYLPQFKIWLAANHLPQVNGRDEGIWRRIRVIPFPVQYSDDPGRVRAGARPIDTRLEEKLLAELPGIFAWAVEGCRRWYAEGLSTCTAVANAVENYRGDMDEIGGFFSDMVEQAEGHRVRGGELYRAYEKWCEMAGRDPMSKKRFGSELNRQGIQSRHSGGTWRVGIRLRSDSRT